MLWRAAWAATLVCIIAMLVVTTITFSDAPRIETAVEPSNFITMAKESVSRLSKTIIISDFAPDKDKSASAMCRVDIVNSVEAFPYDFSIGKNGANRLEGIIGLQKGVGICELSLKLVKVVSRPNLDGDISSNCLPHILDANVPAKRAGPRNLDSWLGEVSA